MINWMNRLRLRVRILFRPASDQEFQDELRFHIEQLEAEYRAGGMTAEEARAAARRQFGNETRIAEQSRDLFHFKWLESFFREVSFGLRSIRKSPGFALVTIAALSVGIGANITVFSFVNAMFFRPLDVFAPGRLIRAYSEGSDPRAPVDYRDYLEYRDRSTSFSSLAMFQSGGLFQIRADGV